MHSFTHLARAIDLRHRSNRQAVVAAVVALGVVMAVNVERSGLTTETVALGVAAGIASFLAWALGRELDPDEPGTALVAAVASIATTLLLGQASLALLTGVLFIARVLLRPSGHALRSLDLLGLVAIGAYLGSQAGGWALALVLAFAVARDRQLPGETPHWARTVAALIAALATGVAVRTAQGAWLAPSIAAWAVLGVGFLAGVTTGPKETVLAVSDIARNSLEPRRLASARRVTLFGLLCAAALAGHPAIVGLAPAWATILAVASTHRFGTPVTA